MKILLVTLSILNIITQQTLALDSERKTKQKLGVVVIENSQPDKNEVLIYYRLEKEEEDHKLNLEADYKLKKEERELILKVEVEF